MVKKIFIIVLLTCIGLAAWCLHTPSLREGDIVFQISGSRQSPAIAAATKSPWTHCGVIVEKNGELYVLEAIRTVQLTPFDKWKARGKGGIVGRRRVMDEPVKIKYKQYLGIPYDIAFRQNNGKYYCSELVYDVYKQQFGIEIGQYHPVSDYWIPSDGIRKMMRNRGIKESQLVIAPADIK